MSSDNLHLCYYLSESHLPVRRVSAHPDLSVLLQFSGPRGGSRAAACHPETVLEETRVERLTLVSEIHHLHFEPPVFLRPGETFWVEGRTLHIRTPDLAVRQVTARPSRPDDAR
ncbi:hypothetical protein [Cellulomonas terrae]|uniref:Uncharacterized protein n=1 Tax=Cellulomonas terrae TaxID=311234 RepID=A0A511JN59_9CELL|nr:hypothetical protein [Cellulomonas terrae]GEL99003.1 hypothetical protein CTE05_25500 [Cellulomonas terrae]